MNQRWPFSDTDRQTNQNFQEIYCPLVGGVTAVIDQLTTIGCFLVHERGHLQGERVRVVILVSCTCLIVQSMYPLLIFPKCGHLIHTQW